MTKREAPKNTLLNNVIPHLDEHFYYELKAVNGNRFDFSNFEEHQIESLMALSHSGLVWKFSDEDSRKKPCDGAKLPPLPAYVIIFMSKSYFFIKVDIIYKLIQEGKKSVDIEWCMDNYDKVIHM